MSDQLNRILLSQFEAALAMLNQCIDACLPEHWEGKIANDSFRQIAYHTLFFTDLYLTPDESQFVLRDLHQRGGDERGPDLSPGLPRAETLRYAGICLEKGRTILAAETPTTLAGPSGFSWLPFSRAEAHIYNIRHIQHHAGALGAYLRRVDEGLRDPKSKVLGWVRTGWK